MKRQTSYKKKKYNKKERHLIRLRSNFDQNLPLRIDKICLS